MFYLQSFICYVVPVAKESRSTMEFDLQTNTQIKSYRRKRIIFCGVFAVIAVFLIGFAIGFVAFKYKDTSQAKTSKIANSDHRIKDEEIQDRFLASVDSEKIGENLRCVWFCESNAVLTRFAIHLGIYDSPIFV